MFLYGDLNHDTSTSQNECFTIFSPDITTSFLACKTTSCNLPTTAPLPLFISWSSNIIQNHPTSTTIVIPSSIPFGRFFSTRLAAPLDTSRLHASPPSVVDHRHPHWPRAKTSKASRSKPAIGMINWVANSIDHVIFFEYYWWTRPCRIPLWTLVRFIEYKPYGKTSALPNLFGVYGFCAFFFSTANVVHSSVPSDPFWLHLCCFPRHRKSSCNLRVSTHHESFITRWGKIWLGWTPSHTPCRSTLEISSKKLHVMLFFSCHNML